MTGVQPMPCPVRLGSVKNAGLPAQLHTYTLEKNLNKIEKLLKKGVDVDCVNNLGQTPLFCASLLGLTNVVELLLQHGADPNHRCEDRSTPVHAAVFSCNPWLLSGLLDAGGDLRLHDLKGRTPGDWAEAGAQEHSPRMLDFLKSCVSHMRSLCQAHAPRDLRDTPTTSKTLLRSPSLLELFRAGGLDLHVNKKLSGKSSPACEAVRCFGYGKLCVDKSGQSVGLLTSIPLISDYELGQAEDEPSLSFTCGSFISMTNYSWRGSRVTVKELQSRASLLRAGQERYLDLLVMELERCSHLFHQHLLQLMAVSLSDNVQRIRLVFERVHVGSLHDLLHHRREEFPVLQVEALLCLVLQICEALLYLHARSLVLRSLSSRTVVIVHPGVAKVTGLGFMVHSEGSCSIKQFHLPLPPGLYNWAAPEVIRCRPCTGKADLYSLCTLIQELYTDAVPWGPVDPRWIKQAVDAGQALTADPAVPQPFYRLVETGLQPRPQNRTSSLQDLRYTLRCDIKEMSQRERQRRRGGLGPVSGGLSMPGWSAEAKPNTQAVEQDCQGLDTGSATDSKVDKEIEDQLRQLDTLLDNETEKNPVQGVEEEEKSTTDNEDFDWDICYRDILPLDEWRLPPHPPLDDTASSHEAWSSSSADAEGQAVRASSTVSEHVSSIVLNLKVSQVLLQQSESSLRNVEMERALRPIPDDTDGSTADEVDGVTRPRGRGVVSEAVGPPPGYRPPRDLQDGPPEWSRGLLLNEDEEQSLYCSAGEESFGSARPRTPQADRNVSRRGEEEREYQGGRKLKSVDTADQTERLCLSSRMSRSQEDGSTHSRPPADCTKPQWTSEVANLVARMTRGRLGTPVGPAGSSESEDVEEQPRQGRQDPLGHSNDHTRGSPEPRRAASDSPESADLEQLFKSFAGIQSESEEETDFHTINQTLNLSRRAWETSGHREEFGSSESDCAQSPVEPSSMFFTPGRDLNVTSFREVGSEMSRSEEEEEEDLDVTVEVCRRTTSAGNKLAIESSYGEYQPAQEESAASEPKPSVSEQTHITTTSHSPGLAELAEISSITCSPAQHQEWEGQNSISQSPHTRRLPPCNSTPRSPASGHSLYLQGAGGCSGPVPHLQSLLDTSPWSTTYTTAEKGTSSTSSATRVIAQEVTDMPTEGAQDPNRGPDAESRPGRTQSDERRGATPSETEEEADDSDTRSCASDRPDSLSSPHSPEEPPDAGSSLLLECEEEENMALEAEEEREGLQRAGLYHELVLDEEEISNNEDITDNNNDVSDDGGGAQAERHDHAHNFYASTQDSEVSTHRSSGTVQPTEAPDSLEETQRAHSTLDEVLQGMLVERSAGQRAVRSPGPVSQNKPQISLPTPQREEEVSEELGCPGGDSNEAGAQKGAENNDGISFVPLAENINEQGENLEANTTWSQPHRVIVLEQTPTKTENHIRSHPNDS